MSYNSKFILYNKSQVHHGYMIVTQCLHLEDLSNVYNLIN